MAGRPENLLPGGGGIERGPAFGPTTHQVCNATRKDGQPCNAFAVLDGSGKCRMHGGGSTPEKRARMAALGPAKKALSAARQAMGGYPAALVTHPAWCKVPGDAVATVQKRADLARAWAARDQDGGTAWRDAITRWRND